MPLGSVLDALPIGLYVVDRDLEVVAWNRLREQGPIGRPRGACLGRPLQAVLGKDGFRATEPVLRAGLRSGKPHEEIVETPGSLYHVRRLPVEPRPRGRPTCSRGSRTSPSGAPSRCSSSPPTAWPSSASSWPGVAHEISNPLAGIAGCAEALASLAAKSGRAGAARGAPVPRPDPRRGRALRADRAVPARLRALATPASAADVGATRGARRCACSSATRRFARLRVRGQPAQEPARRSQIDPDSLKQVVMALAMNAARGHARRRHAHRRAPRARADAHPRRDRQRAGAARGRSAPHSSSPTSPPTPSGGRASASPSPGAWSAAAAAISSTARARAATSSASSCESRQGRA